MSWFPYSYYPNIPNSPGYQPLLDDILWEKILNDNPKIRNRKDVLDYYVDVQDKKFIVIVARKIPYLKKLFPDTVEDDQGVKYKIEFDDYR